MVQEFCVLKCHACELFQVHIVKKAKKWNCKVCREKQSVVKIFGQGSAKDCRIHVQKLNEQRAKNSQNLNEEYGQIDSSDESETVVTNLNDYLSEEDAKGNDSEFQSNNARPSKWQKYLKPDETEESNNVNFQKRSLSCSSNSERDELDEPVPKKLHLSRDVTAVEKNENTDGPGSSSEEDCNCSTDEEESRVIDALNTIDTAMNAVDAVDTLDAMGDEDSFDRIDAMDAISALSGLDALDRLDEAVAIVDAYLDFSE